MCVPVCQVKDSFIMRAQWAVVVAQLVEWSMDQRALRILSIYRWRCIKGPTTP